MGCRYPLCNEAGIIFAQNLQYCLDLVQNGWLVGELFLEASYYHVLSHHSLMQVSCKYGPSSVMAAKTALYSKICIGAVRSIAENCPRIFVFPGIGTVAVGVGSGSRSRTPSACWDYHLP
jgi:hypothetical protein